MMAGTKEKQLAFVREYVRDFNGTQAAIRCGYSPRTATSQGARLLTYANVQAEIERLQAEATTDAVITHREALELLSRIARANVSDFLADDGAVNVEAVKAARPDGLVSLDSTTSTGPNGQIITVSKLRFADKIKALERLAKLLGWDTPARVDVSTEAPIFVLPPGCNPAAFHGTEFAQGTPKPEPKPKPERRKITVV